MILRLKYSKTAQGRFLSHLDLLRTMQRIFRRAGLPLAYSEGFNPHPKISYGSALAVGVTSDGEYLDVELRQELPVAEIAARIAAVVPPGLKVLAVQELQGRQESLTAILNMARYQVEARLDRSLSQNEAEEMVAELLNQEKILVEREGKKGLRSIDIRAGIYQVSVQAAEQTLHFVLELQTGSAGNVRPEEILSWLAANVLNRKGIKLAGSLRIHRLGLYIKEQDSIRTPLEV